MTEIINALEASRALLPIEVAVLEGVLSFLPVMRHLGAGKLRYIGQHSRMLTLVALKPLEVDHGKCVLANTRVVIRRRYGMPFS